jgi:hypothetical protein
MAYLDLLRQTLAFRRVRSFGGALKCIKWLAGSSGFAPPHICLLASCRFVSKLAIVNLLFPGG